MTNGTTNNRTGLQGTTKERQQSHLKSRLLYVEGPRSAVSKGQIPLRYLVRSLSEAGHRQVRSWSRTC